MSKSSLCLFSGLSIAKETAQRILPTADFFPPVARGDLYKKYRKGYRTFLLIDGEFDQSLAVAPGEIVDLLKRGCLIYGSSSIGALRAAELNNMGMVGVGEIFKLINETLLFRDDWLGHLFNKEFTKLNTIPFIELYFLLGPKYRSKLLAEKKSFDAWSKAECQKVIHKICRRQAAVFIPKALDLFNQNQSGQKSKDAIELLLRVKNDHAEHLKNLMTLNHFEQRNRQALEKVRSEI